MSEVLQMDGEGPFDDLEGNAAFGRLVQKFLTILPENSFTFTNGTTFTGTTADLLTLAINGDAQRLFKFSTPTDAALALIFGAAGVAAQQLTIAGTGTDGRLGLTGGNTAFSSTGGGQINSYGTTHATKAGFVELVAANVAGSEVVIDSRGAGGFLLFKLLDSTVARIIAGLFEFTNLDLKILTVGKGLFVKRGTNAKGGTFTANGATPVVVSNTSVTTESVVSVSIKTVGGTPGPVISVVVNAGANFTFTGTAGDTSVYNYVITELIA